jgi:ABC-type transporter Mla subunit MlaD
VQLVDDLVAVVPRITALLAVAERLLRDADGVIARIGATLDAADGMVARIEATRERADSVVAGLEATGTTATRLVEHLNRLQPSLDALEPTLARFAETTDPREVDALVSLIDRLPLLAEQVERDVVPIMRTLTSVSPDLHELLEVSRELNEMLARLPGMHRLRRRD